MRIAIATDAWSPQVNGVVTTLSQTRQELTGMYMDSPSLADRFFYQN